MSNAGRFQIDVSEPYPVWCTITYDKRRLCNIRHDELSDLKYAVDRAIQEAAVKLGKDNIEVLV